MNIGIKVTCAVLGALSLVASPASADVEKSEIEKKTEELTQQTALLEAQTKLLEAKLPVFEGGKEGKLSQGQGGMYPLGAWERVYARLAQGALDICDEVVKAKGAVRTKVALVGQAELDAASRYRLVRQEQQSILAAIAELQRTAVRPQVPGGPAGVQSLAAAPAVVASLLSVAKLFRSDITLYGESVTIANSTLQEQVAGCLRQHNLFEVAHPAITGLYAASGAATTPFLEGVDAIVKARPALQTASDDTGQAARAAAAKALLARSDKFIAELYAVPTAGGRAPVDDVLLGEATADAVKLPAQLLIVSIVQQGGNSMVTSSVWRSDRLYVGGGAIVAFKLIDGGQLVAGMTVMKVDPDFRRVPLQ